MKLDKCITHQCCTCRICIKAAHPKSCHVANSRLRDKEFPAQTGNQIGATSGLMRAAQRHGARATDADLGVGLCGRHHQLLVALFSGDQVSLAGRRNIIALPAPQETAVAVMGFNQIQQQCRVPGQSASQSGGMRVALINSYSSGNPKQF